MEMWCVLWILADIGDPLPDLEHQESAISTDMTVTPTDSTTTACETIISDPIPIKNTTKGWSHLQV